MSDFLTAFPDSDWAYYVAGHDEDALLQVDEPAVLVWEPLWLRPVPASHPDVEQEYDGPSVVRGEDGRFAHPICWIECAASDNGAEPWLGVRYAA